MLKKKHLYKVVSSNGCPNVFPRNDVDDNTITQNRNIVFKFPDLRRGGELICTVHFFFKNKIESIKVN